MSTALRTESVGGGLADGEARIEEMGVLGDGPGPEYGCDRERGSDPGGEEVAEVEQGERRKPSDSGDDDQRQCPMGQPVGDGRGIVVQEEEPDALRRFLRPLRQRARGCGTG